MTAPTDAEKALAVARFCWREWTWGIIDGRVVIANIGTHPWGFWFFDFTGDNEAENSVSVFDAEAVIVERGLREAHGRELLEALSLPLSGGGYEGASQCATATQSERLEALYCLATTNRSEAS